MMGRRTARARRAPSGKSRVTIRIDLTERARLGPGKIALLETIGRERSISAAARALGMSYRRAWLLVDSLNRMFAEPPVLTYPGRAQGGGAEVTRFGEQLIALYRSVERQTMRATKSTVRRLSEALRTGRPATGKAPVKSERASLRAPRSNLGR